MRYLIVLAIVSAMAMLFSSAVQAQTPDQRKSLEADVDRIYDEAVDRELGSKPDKDGAMQEDGKKAILDDDECRGRH